MPDKAANARGWFLKGDSDLNTARRVMGGTGPFDTACFHAQQAVEKYLKGLLSLAGQPIPKTHNLEDLQQLVTSIVSDWPAGKLDLTELTSYAVQIRYDFEFWPDQGTAEQAIALAERVRALVLKKVPKDAQP